MVCAVCSCHDSHACHYPYGTPMYTYCDTPCAITSRPLPQLSTNAHSTLPQRSHHALPSQTLMSALLKSERFTVALALIQEEIALRPNAAETWQQYSEVLDAIGDHESSLVALDRAQSLGYGTRGFRGPGLMG